MYTCISRQSPLKNTKRYYIQSHSSQYRISFQFKIYSNQWNSSPQIWHQLYLLWMMTMARFPTSPNSNVHVCVCLYVYVCLFKVCMLFVVIYYKSHNRLLQPWAAIVRVCMCSSMRVSAFRDNTLCSSHPDFPLSDRPVLSSEMNTNINARLRIRMYVLLSHHHCFLYPSPFFSLSIRIPKYIFMPAIHYQSPPPHPRLHLHPRTSSLHAYDTTNTIMTMICT